MLSCAKTSIQEINPNLAQYTLLCNLCDVICYSGFKLKLHIGIDLVSVMQAEALWCNTPVHICLLNL